MPPPSVRSRRASRTNRRRLTAGACGVFTGSIASAVRVEAPGQMIDAGSPDHALFEEDRSGVTRHPGRRPEGSVIRRRHQRWGGLRLAEGRECHHQVQSH